MSNTPDDYLDMVDALNKHGVEFVILGAYAVTYYGSPRLTEDIDFLIRPTAGNTRKLRAALKEFGSPVVIEGECFNPDEVIQIGVKPVRVDIIAAVTGVSTEAIWKHRVPGRFGGRAVSYISYDLLLQNKLATGRPKDLLDVENLKRVRAHEGRRPTKGKTARDRP